MPGPRARILYVHHRPELGGSPTSLYQLLRALDRDRFEPHVYCPAGPSAELFRGAGVTVHEGAMAAFTHIWASVYSGRRWLVLARELLHLPRHFSDFRACLQRGNYDLVHLNDSPVVVAAWLARRAGLPVVWHLRSALGRDGRDLRSGLLRGTIRRLAAASIAINRNIATTFDVDAHVIPNTVDLTRFKPGPAGPARAELGLDENATVVSYFGYVYPSKGIDEFIHAASLLRARGLAATYLIVGGGVRSGEFFGSYFGRTLRTLGLATDYVSDARRIVADLELDDLFRFVPYTSDTAGLYRASDVVVAPSRGPELGRPVLEAAASGRPVVTSGSLDGAGLILPEETGMLVPRRSPAVLAAALQTLIEAPELRERLGVRARRHAEENFSPETNAAKIMAIYDKVLAERP